MHCTLSTVYLMLLFYSAAQTLGIDFYLEGGEEEEAAEDVNFLATLHPHDDVFILLCGCDGAGWVETMQPGETRRH